MMLSPRAMKIGLYTKVSPLHVDHLNGALRSLAYNFDHQAFFLLRVLPARFHSIPIHGHIFKKTYDCYDLTKRRNNI